METVISAKQLAVGYDKKSVLSGLNLEAIKGQIICLLGPNGAGKTTILRTLAGLLAPVSGTVLVDGCDIARSRKNDIAKKLSLVLSEQSSPALTTVYSLVSMGRTPYTDFLGRLADEDREIIDEALRTTGAEQLKTRYITELSDGERQKVMIARALVQEPELMILDEPTSHLDIKHKIEVIRILQRLSNEKKITCILSLHDIDLAFKGCQTVMLINGGEVAACGSPEEIMKSGVIGRLYDIKGAKYSELLGAVELSGGSGNDVFVVGGGSFGICVYRALSRLGLGITAGVIHENDIELEAASGICSAVVTEKAFEPISEEKIFDAKRLIEETGIVIDSGFPVGTGNKANVELLKYAAASGKRLFSLRERAALEKLIGEESGAAYVRGTDELTAEIKKITQ